MPKNTRDDDRKLGRERSTMEVPDQIPPRPTPGSELGNETSRGAALGRDVAEKLLREFRKALEGVN